MKIRTNYVSNSSSSSFCLLGIIKPEEYDIDDFESDMLEYDYGFTKYYDKICIGANPGMMRDDETLLQFKERICNEFKKNGIKVKVDELHWLKDEGYDG